jgi:alanine dehydrogenase
MVRILSREDVRLALPMGRAIEVVKSAFAQLSTGDVEMPQRSSLNVPRHNGVTLFMPAYLAADDLMAVKILSVFNNNPALGLPLIHALVIVMDSNTGEMAALMDGTNLTALRTGAASGAATDLLARPEASSAAIFGAGVQGRTQLEAVCQVRPVQEAWVYDLTPERAEAFGAEMSQRLSIPVHIAQNPSEAVRQADIICTATTATSPVFSDADVQPGAHINAVGAYTPNMQEIPVETILRAKIVIDQREAALAEAGDLLIPLRQGLIGEAEIHVELGAIAAGLELGRSSPEEITLFKSVGVAVQDAAAANAALAAARELGLGKEVSL